MTLNGFVRVALCVVAGWGMFKLIKENLPDIADTEAPKAKILLNQDYCENDYPDTTIDAGRIEVTMQGNCLKLFPIPKNWRGWHKQFGKAKPGETLRWVAYQYVGARLVGPLIPGDNLEYRHPPGRELYLEGEGVLVFVREY